MLSLLLLTRLALAGLDPAFELPQQADSLRQHGVPAEQATAALGAMQAAGLSAEDASAALQAANQAARIHGPVAQFDALVQAKLDLGLRGEDLAQAIALAHAEQGQGTDLIRQGSPAEGTGDPPEGSPVGEPAVPQQAPEPPEAPEAPGPDPQAEGAPK